MSRKPHPDTRGQGGGDPASAPREDRQCGFEPKDAPAGKVGLALAGVLGSLVLSAGAVAGLMAIVSGTQDHRPAVGTDALPLPTPPPRLQSDPTAERIALERPARQETTARIGEGMRAVEASGWNDPVPAPPPRMTARAHTAGAPVR